MGNKPLKKSEIKSLCAQNEAIARAYGEFMRSNHRFGIVLGIEEAAHFSLPLEEVSITFKSGWRIYTWRITTDFRTGGKNVSLKQLL